MNSHHPSQGADASANGGIEDPRLPDLAWIRQARAESELLVEIERRVKRRTHRRWTVAAGMAVTFVVAGVSWTLLRSHRAGIAPTPEVVTKVWSPQTQALPDGSVVDIREGAHVEIRFDDTLRRVILEKGEAHFTVAKDVKPFVVEAGGVVVKAVGTEFSVQHDNTRVEVLVTEGQVRLERTTGIPGTAASATPGNIEPRVEPTEGPILGAGDQGLITTDSPDPQITTVSEEQIDQRLAWRNSMLEFYHTPLARVVELMNQHAVGRNKVRFELASTGLGDLRFSGFLRSDNSEGLIRLLEENFGIGSTRTGQTITLRRTEP